MRYMAKISLILSELNIFKSYIVSGWGILKGGYFKQCGGTVEPKPRLLVTCTFIKSN